MDNKGAFLRPCTDLLALCDCNNFFVSCERLFRPDLEGRPVVVLSSNDGVVISRSNEVKALGVKMGEPYFKVRSFLEMHGTTVFSSNFKLYEEISSRVMASLRRAVPSMEVYSIDEAFLETPPEGKSAPEEWARGLRGTILRETGIPLSIGMAPTKTAAKLAAERAKKHPGAGGAFALLPGKPWDDFLRDIPVGDIWGIGRRWSDFLKKRGVSTALRLRDSSDDWLDRRMGVRGLRTAWELRGIRCYPIERLEKPQKSIQSSRSFSSPVRDRESLLEAVTEYAMIAGRRLRSQNSLAGSLAVSIRTNRFKESFFRAEQEIIFQTPTDSDIRLIRAAADALFSIYREGHDYEKASVWLGRLSCAGMVQLGLFGDEGEEDRGAALSRAADRLNGEAGRRLLAPAALLGEKAWRPRRDRDSGLTLEDLGKLPVIAEEPPPRQNLQ
ncbi:MAG: Y-family DNA polymerase [Synergistaceae bacterium]|nr:Y-family DNA polymerase [Synergistaceae bacterium]